MLCLSLLAGTAEPYVVKMYDDHLANGTLAVTPLIEQAASSLGQADADSLPSFTVDAATMMSLNGGNNDVVVRGLL